MALPRILGPITLNTVATAANNITANIPILYLPIYDISFEIEPLKSFAFSGAIPMPLGPPILPRLGGVLKSLLSSMIMPPLQALLLTSVNVLSADIHHMNS